ncbi:MAG: hypothetical protein JWN46_1971 [Acidimicrobiales bacterium]|nr:hypothetical protein [Acidimicrobiales bacterium]
MILIDRPIWSAHGRRWAHMVSDADVDELHAFASLVGLPPRAFHGDHYDLPAEWWDQAVALGARVVDPRVLVRRLREAGLRRRPSGRRRGAASPLDRPSG